VTDIHRSNRFCAGSKEKHNKRFRGYVQFVESIAFDNFHKFGYWSVYANCKVTTWSNAYVSNSQLFAKSRRTVFVEETDGEQKNVHDCAISYPK